MQIMQVMQVMLNRIFAGLDQGVILPGGIYLVSG